MPTLRPAQAELENTLVELFDTMKNVPKSSDEYARMVAQAETLYKLQETDHKIDSTKSVSADTWVTAGASIIGVLLIVAYEQKSVVTSKALTLLPKLFR